MFNAFEHFLCSINYEVMSTVSYYTAEGLKKLKEELNYLRDVERPKSSQAISYTLVAESEADLKAGKISVTSPIGKGLLGKEVGDVAEITVPNGTLKFDILEITRN